MNCIFIFKFSFHVTYVVHSVVVFLDSTVSTDSMYKILLCIILVRQTYKEHLYVYLNFRSTYKLLFVEGIQALKLKEP
jgi:hypothetical protein